MANSQEQSLDEDAVFLPVTESSPEFLHSERERRAVERLLSAGPEAFYSSIDTERSGCFLSTEEVSQMSSWAQIYCCSRLHSQGQERGGTDGPGMGDFCSTYFPSNSDVPTPDLELGWPEKSPRVTKERVTVHTSPPAEGEPPVREIIRRNLQKASKVIAIVTDRLTDGAIIGDLHTAASRGVPVYIILNQRSIQENFTLNRLRHPNMQVRVLGGKTFCSRTGRMVVGEMKDKFLLVDLEIVIHGSYSLTWTDAHLHRQLITVLRGSVVDSFDSQFRILYAASFPITDTWRPADTQAHVNYQLKDLIGFKRHLPLEPEITSPPPPPVDSLLDWEAMGVVQRDHWNPDGPYDGMPLQNNTLFDENTPMMDSFTYNGHQFVDEGRLKENASPVTNAVLDSSTTFNSFVEPSSTDLTPERMKRVKCIIEKARSRQLSLEKSTNLHDRTKRLDDEPTETAPKMAVHSFTMRGENSRRQPDLEEKRDINESMSKVENPPTSRKPLILKVPQSETFSSLSDIMRRCQPQQRSPELPKRATKTAVSELSQSMVDLSSHCSDTNAVRVPRFKANLCLHLDHLTPGFALMKKRNDDLKHQLYRTPKDFMPRERPRSSNYGLDWRRSLAERKGDQETEAKK